VLQQRGLDHERGYVDGLRAQGLTLADLSLNEGDDAVARSVDAMRAGIDVIVQQNSELPGNIHVADVATFSVQVANNFT
jgi:hypothetical protein